MKRNRPFRTAAFSGIAFVCCVFAAIAVTGAVPDVTRPTGEIVRYVVVHRTGFLVAAWLGIPITSFFLLFAAGVCAYMREHGMPDAELRWAWGGAVLSSASLLIASAVQGTFAYQVPPPALLRFAYDFYNLALSVGSLMPWGWFVLAISYFGTRVAAWPRALTGFGYLTALVDFILSLSLFFRHGALAPGGAAFFFYVLGLLWTIAVAVWLSRSPNHNEQRDGEHQHVERNRL